jgi:hypothetical protein
MGKLKRPRSRLIAAGNLGFALLVSSSACSGTGASQTAALPAGCHKGTPSLQLGPASARRGELVTVSTRGLSHSPLAGGSSYGLLGTANGHQFVATYNDVISTKFM